MSKVINNIVLKSNNYDRDNYGYSIWDDVATICKIMTNNGYTVSTTTDKSSNVIIEYGIEEEKETENSRTHFIDYLEAVDGKLTEGRWEKHKLM